MKVNRLLSSLIIFVALFSFLSLIINKENVPSQPLSLAWIKEDNGIFSGTFFYEEIFSDFVFKLALFFFFCVFYNIDRFHLKEENKFSTEIEYEMYEKEELLKLKHIVQSKIDKENLEMKRKFFHRYIQNTIPFIYEDKIKEDEV